ncbi:AMP-binding protein [Actibacterium sp. 188UL27-1]|uniref:AMP-binding protein n=1 Tax=Actibacterium sp. 188UL27-1 TaxID=2786961 RepID=UPI00195C325E|nr:AMP-binding protein [Actibacterium sp. 188UL27-1]MBM7067781.1 AMP-binding protein [Actibacterium sp. 188UL27-1]
MTDGSVISGPIALSSAWDLPDQLNMAEWVCDRWARLDPAQPAILDASGPDLHKTSFAELRRMADGLAHHLTSLGLKPGDRIGVLRSQHAWTAAAHIAIWKLGAISIPLFTLFGPDALSMRLRDAGARAVVTDAVGAERLASMDLCPTVVPDKLDLDNAPFVPAGTGPNDPAVLIYTSGTTGPPKGALHGHRILCGHLPGVERSHDLMPRPGDRIWTPADWAWIGGLFDVLMPGLYHGLSVIAARLPKFTGAAAADVIARAAVRNVFFPPTALRRLRAEGTRIPDLRSVASGGEPLGTEMLDWGRTAFGLEINEFYGQTECNMTVSSCAALFPARPGFIGRAVPGFDVAVLDPDAAGEGDIAVRRGAASMMLGYWNNPQATTEKFKGDWMLTGDRGVIKDGFIRFVGRSDDVITSSGYRIGPAEVEDCLLTHPAVDSAGVIGKPDPDRTQIVCAFVVLRPGETPTEGLEQELKDHVKTRLAAHEYPREVHFVDDLPLTVTGKIMRKDLRKLALERLP